MRTPVFVLTRADGTSLYPLRDMTYTIEKLKRAKDKNIVVLGEDHKLYANQLKIALNLIGYKFPEIIHYSFILLQEKNKRGKMSTREGKVVLLSDLMKEAVEKTKREILRREIKFSKNELDKLSKDIGYGAIKFSILKVSNDKNVIFSWNSALNFEGDTGPYIQYTYVRTNSILEKSNQKIQSNIDFSILNDDLEISLIKKLSDFQEIIKDTLNNYKPSLLCNYLLELSHLFNEFYHKNKVIDSENNELTNSRLFLVYCVGQVLKNGLSLLGINSPKRM